MPGIPFFLHPLDPGARVSEEILGEFPQAERYVPLDVHIGIGPVHGVELARVCFMRVHRDSRRMCVSWVRAVDDIPDPPSLLESEVLMVGFTPAFWLYLAACINQK